jgi:hypothetical protein
MEEMAMSADTAELEVAAGHVLEMFEAVCGDPDNQEVALRADQALWKLDELMAGPA